MKKILSVSAIVGILMVATIGASVASETGGGDNANQPTVSTPNIITGENDQRIFTPEMNNRERYAIQKALKKRALAQRNQILLNAAQQDAAKTDVKNPAE